ncbi:MAG TPA: hypothetical protein VHH73_12920 [Verrucomicrobiae bacterium]|nr:hypothetical protein [Verrucomicrobiae bacterium]
MASLQKIPENRTLFPLCHPRTWKIATYKKRFKISQTFLHQVVASKQLTSSLATLALNFGGGIPSATWQNAVRGRQ